MPDSLITVRCKRIRKESKQADLINDYQGLVMKMKFLVAAAPLFFSMSSWAVSFESCPAPADITGKYGIYTATTASAKGEWLGVLSPSAVQNQKVVSFENGVFYPSNNASGTVGAVGYCQYKVGNGEGLNMRYRPNESSDVLVQLRNLDKWKQVTTEIGLVLYECTNQAPGDCAFSDVEQ